MLLILCSYMEKLFLKIYKTKIFMTLKMLLTCLSNTLVYRKFCPCTHDVCADRTELLGWMLHHQTPETEAVCTWTVLPATRNIWHWKQAQWKSQGKSSIWRMIGRHQKAHPINYFALQDKLSQSTALTRYSVILLHSFFRSIKVSKSQNTLILPKRPRSRNKWKALVVQTLCQHIYVVNYVKINKQK